ncbi:protein kinase [Niveomyces insectorum RCEF 264]|uniref:non-specific serine/threonine protein kinase n=1 Tax=Niveomyces insectorum RCEF 264 TaxID=1081102 RepID=A0A162LBV8_9HYPO|nr:protein kinase [Niveomyces insectorum RCEF 264]
MGQGYSLSTPLAGSAGIDVPELGDLVYEKAVGSARFLKSIRARHHDGVVLVKVLVKPYTPMALGPYRDAIMRERRILADVPNALGYQRIVETDTNGYLVRQFLYNSLYDRMSTRPFLEDIEKKWLAFQLLCAVRDCHARDVYHGDIKTENVLVTSWNWLYLSDFSSAFKPVLLPDDNPGDFSYYFDTSGRRTCYLAPERFVSSAAAAAAATSPSPSDDDDDDDENGGGNGYASDSEENDQRTDKTRRRPGRATGGASNVPVAKNERRRGGEGRTRGRGGGGGGGAGRHTTTGTPPNRITWAMDVFSAGCVIAELVLESPIFSLSQLFRYRRGEYDPVISHLSRIPDRDLADMIAHMIQLDPQKRYSAKEYLEFYRGKVFPDYFYYFLHQYMEVITDPSSGQYPVSGATRNLGEADERIDRVYYDFDKISYFLGFQDDGEAGVSNNNNKSNNTNRSNNSNAGVTAGQAKSDPQQNLAAKIAAKPPPPPRLGLGLFPVRLSIPSKEHTVRVGTQAAADNGALIFLTLIVASIRNTARAASKIRACDVLLAFSERLTDEAKLDRVLPYLMALLNDRTDMVVVAAVRSITQLLAMVRTVSPVNAHVFLEYILPRMQAALLNGSSAAAVARSGDSRRGDSSPVVRATYAACLGTLATTASRFLETAAKVERVVGTGDDADIDTESLAIMPGGKGGAAGEGVLTVGERDAGGFDGFFDAAQRELLELFEQHTKALIEDTDPSVRRAFLTSVPDLCLFFGAADANDIIVTHLNTYLNDRDWTLKCAFFETIVGVATFLGSVSLEEFILPLMIQALTDLEEHVVHAVLQALAELADLGLFSQQMVWELVNVVARFTVHPNIWIREAAARFCSAATTFLSPAQVRCLFMPLVAPYLKPGMSALRCSELELLDRLQNPLSRAVFDQALSWALKTERGLFWKPVQKLRGFPFGMSSSSAAVPSSSGPASRPLARETIPRSLSKVGRNDEDEQWIGRLRNLGMSADDEFKLLALREFLWRLSRLKLHESAASSIFESQQQQHGNNNGRANRQSSNTNHVGGHTGHSAAPNFNNLIPLRSLGVTPQTVLFDEEPQKQALAPPPLPGSLAAAAAMDFDVRAPRSIEDALQDASMTIDDPVAKRRRAALNVHKSRLNSRNRGSPSPAVRNGFLAVADSGEPLAAAAAASVPTTADDSASLRTASLSSPQAAQDTLAPPSDDASSDNSSSKRTGSGGPLLRHRPSAINLLSRKESIKSGAETSTTEANAFGQVEGRSALTGGVQSRSPVPSDDLDSTASDPDGGLGGFHGAASGVRAITRYRAHHTYTGNDPNVLRMLDTMFVENFPHDLAEFSPMVTPISRKRTSAGAGTGSGGGGGGSSNNNGGSGGHASHDVWRPSGQMVATFSEHNGPINRVVVAPDHAFFLTGGDDGTVRVWDTQRLERNISHRSRQVYRHAPGARVLALCFIENTHCFISCASDGSVHVVKVDYLAVAGSMPRYNRLRLLREYQLPRGEWAVWCEHFKQEANSVLVLATNRSRVLGIDLRTMTLLFALASPVHHGTPTCFVVDRRHNWLVVATSHGVLDLWDLRFKMRLKGWGVPGGAPIYRLTIHPSKGRGKWICVAGGTGHGEVTVWDLEKTLCREVYRVGGGGGGGGGDSLKYGANAYEPWDVDEDRPEGMLGRFATNIDPVAFANGGAGAIAGADAALLGLGSGGSNGGNSNSNGNSGGGDKGVRAMMVGSSSGDDHRDVRHVFIVTGGSDKKLRFWDVSRIENSVVYSGLLADEGRPTFSAVQVTTSMTVNTERLPRSKGSNKKALV